MLRRPVRRLPSHVGVAVILLAAGALGLGSFSACSSDSNEATGVTTSTTASSGGAGGTGGAGAAGGVGGSGGEGGIGFGGQGGAPPRCEKPAMPAGPEVTFSPDYAGLYEVFELGPVPGVPDRLGGCVIKYDDPNTMLIAGASETTQGKIYSIGLERGPCGHILGFVGEAQPVADTPYVDANLVYAAGDLMFYTQWPQFKLSQLPAGASAPAIDTDFLALGMSNAGDSGPGGVGFVPPGLAGAGGLRVVTWPGGHWFHVDISPAGNGLFDVNGITETALVPNEPGGFAYVPAGSAGFDNQSLIVAEWRSSGVADDRVATYEVDDQGDPIPATRKEFFTAFPRPWGAYFEPITGDYLFLTWGNATPPDRVYIVQGFVPPPPVPN